MPQFGWGQTATARAVVPALTSPSGWGVAVLQGFLGSPLRQSGQALRSWTIRNRHS